MTWLQRRPKSCGQTLPDAWWVSASKVRRLLLLHMDALQSRHSSADLVGSMRMTAQVLEPVLCSGIFVHQTSIRRDD